jgi:hypothetical protein
MVCDALDEARQHFLGRRFRLRNHADIRIMCGRILRGCLDARSINDRDHRRADH